MTGQYNWVCEPVDYGSSPLARRALNLAWWYYFSKEMIIATGLMVNGNLKFIIEAISVQLATKYCESLLQ